MSEDVLSSTIVAQVKMDDLAEKLQTERSMRAMPLLRTVSSESDVPREERGMFEDIVSDTADVMPAANEGWKLRVEPLLSAAKALLHILARSMYLIKDLRLTFSLAETR